MTVQSSDGAQVKEGVALPGLKEDEHSSKYPPVIDPVGAAKKKKTECLELVPSGDNVFLAASYTMLLVELSAALFTLSVIHLKLKDALVHKVTLGYYVTYAVLSLILTADSLLDLRGCSKERAENKISSKQYRIKCIQNSATVISSCMWIALSIASIVMELGHQSAPLRLFALFLSIAAPVLGMLSAFTRAYDVIHSSRAESAKLKEAEERAGAGVSQSQRSGSAGVAARTTKEGAALWMRTGLYVIIAVFEAAHCMCHIYEAYLLVGETNKLFSITDQVLLGTQVGLALLFIVFCAIEHVLEKGKKGCDLPASANDNASRTVAVEQSGTHEPSSPVTDVCCDSPSTSESVELASQVMSIQGATQCQAMAYGQMMR